MKAVDLVHLAVNLAAARATADAQRLELSRVGMPQRLVELEGAVGLRLIERASAKWGLTPAGDALLPWPGWSWSPKSCCGGAARSSDLST
ncbi:MAG: hypothetical protein ACRCY8_18740 [Dermatophilaceae bacterium]